MRSITGFEQEQLEKTFVKENRSQIESDIRKGRDSKGRMYDENGQQTDKEADSVSESRFKASKRQEVIEEIQRKADIGDVERDAQGAVINGKDGKPKLTDQGIKKAEDQLNTEFNKLLHSMASTIAHQKFEKIQHEAKTPVGMGTRIASKMTSGTYDVRNLSGLKTDRREGIGTKAAVGIVAAVATGMRMGFKKSTGMDVGTPQGNFLKDIGQTISEALKNAKIDIKLDSGGGSHGPAKNAHAPVDDHGGH